MKFCLSTLLHLTQTAAGARFHIGKCNRDRVKIRRQEGVEQREGESAQVKVLTGRYSNLWPLQ